MTQESLMVITRRRSNVIETMWSMPMSFTIACGLPPVSPLHRQIIKTENGDLNRLKRSPKTTFPCQKYLKTTQQALTYVFLLFDLTGPKATRCGFSKAVECYQKVPKCTFFRFRRLAVPQLNIWVAMGHLGAPQPPQPPWQRLLQPAFRMLSSLLRAMFPSTTMTTSFMTPST